LADEVTAELAPPTRGEIVDTVGAGDAFSAVTILGLLQGWPLAELAKRAVDFAAEVCRMRGATANDQDLYQRCLRKWGV